MCFVFLSSAVIEQFSQYNMLLVMVIEHVGACLYFSHCFSVLSYSFCSALFLSSLTPKICSYGFSLNVCSGVSLTLVS
jgi:hypothetical protein